jgi:hypothetical protein
MRGQHSILPACISYDNHRHMLVVCFAWTERKLSVSSEGREQRTAHRTVNSSKHSNEIYHSALREQLR